MSRFTAKPASFDLLLMAIQMPELSGPGATHHLRAQGFGTVPSIAITANAMKGERERCRAADMNDYISKPIRRNLSLR